MASWYSVSSLWHTASLDQRKCFPFLHKRLKLISPEPKNLSIFIMRICGLLRLTRNLQAKKSLAQGQAVKESRNVYSGTRGG